jgi:hypothetical protein
MQKQSFTAILEREGDLYVALCPALAVASQGSTVESVQIRKRSSSAYTTKYSLQIRSCAWLNFGSSRAGTGTKAQ